MMTFSPPELGSRLRAALKLLDGHGTISVEGAELGTDFGSDDFEDINVVPSTLVDLCLQRSEDVHVELQRAISMINDARDSSTDFDGLTFHSATRTLQRISPQDGRSWAAVDHLVKSDGLYLRASEVLGGNAVSLGLTRMEPVFGLAVLFAGLFYDKYLPPMMSDDLFVAVEHPDGLAKDAAIEAIGAYLFEISSALDLVFAEAPRPEEGEAYLEDEELEQLEKGSTSFRPLLVGAALGPLIRQFNLGLTASDYDTALLSFVKCIEYVSSTVVREKQYEDLRKRLLTREVLNPSANYLDSIIALVDENKVFTRDVEALRLTIERCCDPLLLAKLAPPFLKSLAAVAFNSRPADRRTGLGELSAALSATRNQIAHAKANYESTGKECPSDQLGALVSCAKAAAEHCIRWYAALNPTFRRA